jgi:hypothetical protein
MSENDLHNAFREFCCREIERVGAAEEFREEIERGNYHRFLLTTVLVYLLADNFPEWLRSAFVEAILAGIYRQIVG